MGDAAPREIVVENDHIRAVFTNEGARLLHWQLKDYLENDGAPVDLVPAALPPGEPAPFAVELGDARLSHLANAGLYRASTEHLQLADEPAALAFDYEDASGLRVRKTFRFDPQASPYQFMFTVEAMQAGAALNPCCAGARRSAAWSARPRASRFARDHAASSMAVCRRLAPQPSPKSCARMLGMWPSSPRTRD